MGDVVKYSANGGHAECRECDWSTAGGGSMGRAAQHAQKHNHYVVGISEHDYSYIPEGHPEHKQREEA